MKKPYEKTEEIYSCIVSTFRAVTLQLQILPSIFRIVLILLLSE